MHQDYLNKGKNYLIIILENKSFYKNLQRNNRLQHTTVKLVQ